MQSGYTGMRPLGHSITGQDLETMCMQNGGFMLERCEVVVRSYGRTTAMVTSTSVGAWATPEPCLFLASRLPSVYSPLTTNLSTCCPQSSSNLAALLIHVHFRCSLFS